jgi:hypothetical protein
MFSYVYNVPSFLLLFHSNNTHTRAHPLLTKPILYIIYDVFTIFLNINIQWCAEQVQTWEATSPFGIVVVIVFLNVFYMKIHWNNIIFLKFIFYISTSKLFKITKKFNLKQLKKINFFKNIFLKKTYRLFMHNWFPLTIVHFNTAYITLIRAPLSSLDL